MIHDALRALRQRAHQILITTHWNPDGDAVGSALGWAHYLRASGHHVCVLFPNAPSQALQRSPGYDADSVMVAESEPVRVRELFHRAEWHFALDYNSPARVGAALEPFVANFAGRNVLVDHHQQPEDCFTVRYHDTTKSSTCELIADLISADEGWGRVHPACAENLLMGLITDSGSFRYPSTTVHTFTTAAQLVAAGAQPHIIHERLFDANPLSRLKTLGMGLANARQVAKGKAVIVTLSVDEMIRAGYAAGDSEGLVNWGLSVEGVVVSALLREDQPDQIKMSLRSKGSMDVNEWVRTHYSGGGHQNAAGGLAFGTLADVSKEVEEKLVQWLS